MMPNPTDKPQKKRRKTASLAQGRRITTARKVAGISMETLAGRIGVSRQYIGQLELGIRDGSIPTLRAIARALGVSLASLLGES